jgi:hypothetical protein
MSAIPIMAILLIVHWIISIFILNCILLILLLYYHLFFLRCYID